MKKFIPVLFSLLAFHARAQNTLIHYWHFNDPANQAAQYFLPSIVPIRADFSILDTSKAKIIYEPVSGTSAAYTTYYDFNQGDTINARMGHEVDTPGYSLRLRNPSDSMQAVLYLPTPGYKNIKLSFETEASSAGNGAKTQYFAYSLDSGLTWSTSGMSVLTTYFNITDNARDSVATSWGKVILSFDSTANDNPRFVVRMTFGTPNTGTNGNDRFDNVALDGDSLNSTPPPPPPADTITLIHYWNFNLLDTAYHNPGIPAFLPDSTLLPVSNVKLVYALSQNAPANYRGYVDRVSGTALNARYGTPAGQAFRVRNPSDQVTMFLYMPTTGYRNIHLSFATETSSLLHGQLVQNFQYSTDGFTYNNGHMNISSDSTRINWATVNIDFGSDSGVNNNPNLVLMMTFAGNTTDTMGNNRFDNIVVEGDSIHHVGVQTVQANNRCLVYPNPANDLVYISAPLSGSKLVNVINTAGQKVYSARYSGEIYGMNVQGLVPGIYQVQVLDEDDGRTFTGRFVKQ